MKTKHVALLALAIFAIGGLVTAGTTNYDDLALSGWLTAATSVTAPDLAATDDITVGDDLAVTGLATVGETLGVTGNTTVTGDINANGGLDIPVSIVNYIADYQLKADNTTGLLMMTAPAASSGFNIVTGNMKVGNGTPGTTLDGEDAYVEGALEVDGTTRIDGLFDANARATITGPDASGQPVAILEQLDADKPFVSFTGTSGANQTASISSIQGDGSVIGPKDSSSAAGWNFYKMMQVQVNQSGYWLPVYTTDAP